MSAGKIGRDSSKVSEGIEKSAQESFSCPKTGSSKLVCRNLGGSIARAREDGVLRDFRRCWK